MEWRGRIFILRHGRGKFEAEVVERSERHGARRKDRGDGPCTPVPVSDVYTETAVCGVPETDIEMQCEIAWASTALSGSSMAYQLRLQLRILLLEL